MESGRLDRRITIQVKTVTQEDSGEPVESWQTVVQRRAASKKPVRGSEGFSEPQVIATEQVEFWVRYSANVAALQPNLHRIICPALDDGETEIEGNRLFDILAVHELGRREGFKIIAERNPDLGTVDIEADETAPTITSASAANNAEGAVLAHSLTANESVTWSLIGGADEALFEISGSTLRWLGDGTKVFASPDDSDLDGAYIAIVRATDLAANTADQTITITVTEVVAGDPSLDFSDPDNSQYIPIT